MYFICHRKRFYYKYQNGYFCTGNKFDFASLYWPIAPISLCCTGSYHCTETLQSPQERGWCCTSKELGQPWGVPFYTQSSALPFYSTAPPWMAPGDDSTCCPAGHRPWGDPCTGSVGTEPWPCCRFPGRYGLWGKEIWAFLHCRHSSYSIFFPVHSTLYSYSIPNIWKQTREILFLSFSKLFLWAFSLISYFSIILLLSHCRFLVSSRQRNF